ncbi:MAG TPA: UDP-N-acetylenolpyruvoylglucosamine reductase [Lachnospiraceae bacterium]|nr:UDP-N-acetylenolpyruvoylglucosamine reductase [Lachnospiraceae bacterium]
MGEFMFQTKTLYEIAKNSDIRINEPMSLHTTFRIGGPADIFIEVNDIEEFASIIRYLQKEECRYFIMGNGSNLLVDDKGYRGIIISTMGKSSNKHLSGKKFVTALDDICIYDKCSSMEAVFFAEKGYSYNADRLKFKNLVHAGSGVLLSKLASVVCENGFAGFEFAGGIPGTIGGAVAMNAGAYGGEVKDVIEGARVITGRGDIVVLKKDELEMSYRKSIIQAGHIIILDALFAFKSGDKEQILSKMKEFNDQRKSKQPLEYGSAGSTFKRPEGHFAGKLIQDAGLKGYRCGDIMVSEKHSGFIVNVGNGTFEQAMNVISHVKDEVMKNSGVSMELEVKVLS